MKGLSFVATKRMFPADIKARLEGVFCSCVRRGPPEQDLVDDGLPVSGPTYVGDSILLWGKKQSKWPYQCFVGPDWPIVVMTYFLIILAHIVVLSVVAPLGWPVTLIGCIGGIILLYYYTATIASNPGIIFKKPSPPSSTPSVDVEMASSESKPLSNRTAVSDIIERGSAAPVIPSTIECGVCQLQRPYSARHCCYCSACINELDHHCPWCGKCIGEENIKVFNCFVGWISFQCYFLSGTLLYFLLAVYAVKSLPH